MGNCEASRKLLRWYDTHARELPWRVGPGARAAGQRPDPYGVWLSEIMLQQTTVATVRGRYGAFLARWPTVGALAAADENEVMGQWAGLGYYSRARNLLKCARVVVARHGGEFPRDYRCLLALPGIGPYTAAAIAAIAFDQPQAVVDGNVERVVIRLLGLRSTIAAARKAIAAEAQRLTPARRPGDHAQAMMDLGAGICTPRAPDCARCPLSGHCRAHARGLAASLPLKAARVAKPLRRGIAYIATRADGALLLERRPARGLLGGMLGWPGAEWAEVAVEKPPIRTRWRQVPGEVRHSFTHFHLRLELRVARLAMDAVPETGHFVAPERFSPARLPTVMRKAFEHAQDRAGGK